MKSSQAPSIPLTFTLEIIPSRLEPELVQTLKESTQLDQTRFFENLIQKVGMNRYLREMIQEAVAKAEDPGLLAKQLQAELQTL
ncbi:MAG: hypothetical protein MPW15_26450 [Candidatus Manganitrophus sp.]|nr:hypothetical protein [Candidatus Manganitrophus sp.]